MTFEIDLHNKFDLSVLIIIACMFVALGFGIGILVSDADLELLTEDYAKLKAEVDAYKESEFSIRLQGRELVIWDGLGLMDSVEVGR